MKGRMPPVMAITAIATLNLLAAGPVFADPGDRIQRRR